MIEPVGAEEYGDEEIRQPVVVHVAPHDCLHERVELDADLVRDLRERAVLVVEEQL